MNELIRRHFNILVELVGLDKALKFYELRETLGIDKDSYPVDLANLVLTEEE